jgi:cation transport ATPase
MKNLVAILVLISSITLLVFGLKAMFMPRTMLDFFDIDPRGVFGMNSIRSNLGGMLIACASLMLMGLITQNNTWFFASILILGIILFGRIISFIADGWTTAALSALVIEILIIVVLIVRTKVNLV